MFKKLFNPRIIPQINKLGFEFTANPSVLDVLGKNNSNGIKTFSHLSTIPKSSRETLLKFSHLQLVPKCTNINQARTSATSGDHVRLWVIERIVSAALPVLLPVAFIVEQPIVDAVLAGLIVIHSHWGLEGIILDYARPIIVGPIVPKIAFLGLNILSALTLAGLLLLIFNGPGLSKTIKKAWTVGKKQSV